MTDNEKQFIRTFVDFESNMKSARQYIKETYGVDSELNEEGNYIIYANCVSFCCSL